MAGPVPVLDGTFSSIWTCKVGELHCVVLLTVLVGVEALENFVVNTIITATTVIVSHTFTTTEKKFQVCRNNFVCSFRELGLSVQADVILEHSWYLLFGGHTTSRKQKRWWFKKTAQQFCKHFTHYRSQMSYIHPLWLPSLGIKQHSLTKSHTDRPGHHNRGYRYSYHRNLVDQLFCGRSGMLPLNSVTFHRNPFPYTEPYLLNCKLSCSQVYPHSHIQCWFDTFGHISPGNDHPPRSALWGDSRILAEDNRTVCSTQLPPLSW